MWRPAFTSPSWRRSAIGLALGLALAVAGCGPIGGSTPTVASTVAPTPTMTPTSSPCTIWRVIPSPTTTRYAHSVLTSVSALAPSEAWAVGATYSGDGGPVATLIEQWDGSTWRIVASPGAGFLNGVAAVSSQDVWAVGGQNNTTLIERWNGTQWRVIPSPNASPSMNSLTGVAALDANTVWAAGAYTNATGVKLPLIERWDGTQWRIVASPIPSGATASGFTSLSAIPGSNHVWAVGSVRYGQPPSGGTGYFQPLIERWDGGAWQIVASPTLPSEALAGELNGVVALSETDAWAVGDYTASNHTIRTLIAHWDGTTWEVTASPDEWGALAGVAVVGARDVRAVGYIFVNDGNNQHGIVERWDGSVWRMIESPMPQGIGHSSLSMVAADGAGGYWAVGHYYNESSAFQTLIERCS